MYGPYSSAHLQLLIILAVHIHSPVRVLDSAYATSLHIRIPSNRGRGRNLDSHHVNTGMEKAAKDGADSDSPQIANAFCGVILNLISVAILRRGRYDAHPLLDLSHAARVGAVAGADKEAAILEELRGYVEGHGKSRGQRQ
ncbi:hypothetical protein B0H14DRAFT_2588927 [Mycena olivaceomarginata]|nr:hypothetical protein B0H14DRAFT_2588927 [Mycena olivaceomarginata]